MRRPRKLRELTVARDAGTGRFITIWEACRRPESTVVETVRVGRSGRWKGGRSPG
jgi:hypothetical protein